MRSKMVLVLSLLMGVVTTALFYKYMNQFSETETVSEPMVEVVIAKEKINKNETIAAEKLEIALIPEKSVLPQAIKSIAEAEGKLADSMIEKGEPILSHRLVSQTEEAVYVSRKIREGYRAVALPIDNPRSVANLIEPEDAVDVIFSKADQKAAVKSEVLLEKVRVLAVGRKMVVPEQTKEPFVEYSTVTLELKPEDALKVIKFSQEGTIHFILNTRPVVETQAMQEQGTETDSEG